MFCTRTRVPNGLNGVRSSNPASPPLVVFRMMALLVLMAGALLGVCRASLPPAVGNDNCQPDELSPAFSLPLLPTNTSNETFYLTVDPTQKDLSGQPLPLVLLAINRSDPWTSAMLASNASLDQFLTEAAPDRSTTRFGGRGSSSSSSSSGGGGSSSSSGSSVGGGGGEKKKKRMKAVSECSWQEELQNSRLLPTSKQGRWLPHCVTAPTGWAGAYRFFAALTKVHHMPNNRGRVAIARSLTFPCPSRGGSISSFRFFLIC